MFKWIRKRLLKGMIEDIISNLPEPELLKEKMFEIFEEHKDEILNKIKELIKDFVMKFINEKLKK
jgi:RNA-binding protein YhbY